MANNISDWMCNLCTFINDGNTLTCEMCNNPRQVTTAESDLMDHPLNRNTSAGECWTCSYTEELTQGSQTRNRSIIFDSQNTTPKVLQFEPSQTAAGIPSHTSGRQHMEQQRGCSINLTPSSNTVSESGQEYRTSQAAVMNITRPTTGSSELQRLDNENRSETGIQLPNTATNLQNRQNSNTVPYLPNIESDETRVKSLYHEDEWVCSVCTLKNIGMVSFCTACENPRDVISTSQPSNTQLQTETQHGDTTSIISSDESIDDSLYISTGISDMSQLRWEVEDIERRINTARSGKKNDAKSEEKESLLSRLQNAKMELQQYENLPRQSNVPHMTFTGWSCSHCTFINTANESDCVICGNTRADVSDSDIDNTSVSTEDVNITSYDKPDDKNEHIHRMNDIPDVSGTNILRLVMIGPTGTGKSSTGNTILGRNEFQASMPAVSVTKLSKLCIAYRFNRIVHIVDTPGIFDTDAESQYVKNEILKCIGMTAPGPHAILLVVNVSVRFSNENKESVKHFVNYFGNDLYRYLIIIFTRKDELERNNMTIDKYLETIPEELENVLARCSNRYITFSNVAGQAQKDLQAQELFQIIDHMIEQNNGQFFTNDLYNETDKQIRKRMANIYKNIDEHRATRIRNIRKEQSALFERKYQKLVLDKQRRTGTNLNPTEKNELREITIRQVKAIIQQRIDAVDSELRPLMRRSQLRNAAQREIEEERPGTLERLKNGALKVSKVVGMGGLGVLVTPIAALAGAIGVAAVPFVAGAAGAMSFSDDSD